MRLTLLSRASDLAVLQTRLVARALRTRWPDLDVQLVTRSSQGDRDRRVSLWAAESKGLFTADLSTTLAAGEADAAVHSWKDLPVAGSGETVIAATLERADPRDVLLVHREAVAARRPGLAVLTSSPRRAWQLGHALPSLLPWPIETVECRAVRGNIATRLTKLATGREGDALVVAKAALDRLLSEDAPTEATEAVRAALAMCRWMVLPVRDCPTAPAQGAIAVEVRADRADVLAYIRAIDHPPTREAVEAERAILAGTGGGCHEAFGATALVRDYGRVVSVRGRLPDGAERADWSLVRTAAAPPRVDPSRIWPRPDERDGGRREPLAISLPPGAEGLWVSRADAWPDGAVPTDSQVVWTAGTRTWRKLAARGLWVHGCADGLGDAERPAVDRLAGRELTWLRLTHADAADPTALATYVVRQTLPVDLAERSHFFWTSGQLFREALARTPAIGAGWHASGPGRTARVIRETLGPDARTTVWLDYEQWHKTVTL